jgi:hypothetical protein
MSFPPRNWVAEGSMTRLANDDEFGAYLYIAEQIETEPFTEDTQAILDAWKLAHPEIVNAPSPSFNGPPIQS